MTALILTVLVKASLIMAAAGAAALASRRASAAKRHMLLTISIIALLALPALTMILPSLRIPVFAGASVNNIAATVSETVKKIDAPRVTERTRTLARESAAPIAGTEVASTPAEPLPWGTILFAAYLAGVLVLLLKLIAEQRAVRGLARQSTEFPRVQVTSPDAQGLRPNANRPNAS